MLQQIQNGRTDLVFDYRAQGHAATAKDSQGVSLIQWCGAAFHAHWQLCQFFIKKGADVNDPQSVTGETPLHRAAAFGGEM